VNINKNYLLRVAPCWLMALNVNPFLTCDHRIMLERAQDVMNGIKYARRVCGAPRAIIGVEDNKPDAIAALEAALPADGTYRSKCWKQSTARCCRDDDFMPFWVGKSPLASAVLLLV